MMAKFFVFWSLQKGGRMGLINILRADAIYFSKVMNVHE